MSSRRFSKTNPSRIYIRSSAQLQAALLQAELVAQMPSCHVVSLALTPATCISAGLLLNRMQKSITLLHVPRQSALLLLLRVHIRHLLKCGASGRFRRGRSLAPRPRPSWGPKRPARRPTPPRRTLVRTKPFCHCMQRRAKLYVRVAARSSPASHQSTSFMWRLKVRGWPSHLGFRRS